jgi:hypothetical protein
MKSSLLWLVENFISWVKNFVFWISASIPVD